MEKFIKHQKTKGSKKHGFLTRTKTHSGKKVLKKRRAAKRHSLTI